MYSLKRKNSPDSSTSNKKLLGAPGIAQWEFGSSLCPGDPCRRAFEISQWRADAAALEPGGPNRSRVEIDRFFRSISEVSWKRTSWERAGIGEEDILELLEASAGSSVANVGP